MPIPLISGQGSSIQPAQAGRAGSVPQQAPEASPKPSREQVQQVAQQLQRVAEPVARNLQFSVDGDTGKTVIRVVDSDTNEVIRQIPGEEILAIARAVDRLQGLLLKGEA